MLTQKMSISQWLVLNNRNSVISKYNPKKNKWTKEEDLKIKSFVKKGVNSNSIVKKFENRSRDAVLKRISKLKKNSFF